MDEPRFLVSNRYFLSQVWLDAGNAGGEIRRGTLPAGRPLTVQLGFRLDF